MDDVIWSTEVFFELRLELCETNLLSILPPPDGDILRSNDPVLKIRPDPPRDQKTGRVRWNLDTSSNLQLSEETPSRTKRTLTSLSSAVLSNTVTECPRLLRATAVARPPKPAPTTKTFNLRLPFGLPGAVVSVGVILFKKERQLVG